MDRLLKFMFVLTIATSSYGYVYQRHEPEMPDTPPELDLDENYPKEYIETLVDSLSSAELEKLRSMIDLHHRTGTPSSPRCSWYPHRISPTHARDESGVDYYVIQSDKLQTVIDIEVCNYTKGHNCYTEVNGIHSAYANCCEHKQDKMMMHVANVPVKELKARKNYKKQPDDDIIQKDLYFNSRCECTTIPLDTQDLENNTDVCKLDFSYD